MINWEVILWTCITIAVLMGIIGLILSFISAKNMRKRREQMAEIHTTLAIGTKVMFAGGIYGKVVRMNGDDEVIGVEVAPKTIIDISRFAIQAIEKKMIEKAARHKMPCHFSLPTKKDTVSNRVFFMC